MRAFGYCVGAVLLVLTGSASCDPGTPGAGHGQTSFTLVDSAGVIVAVSADTGVHAPVTWDIDSDPDLIIGNDDTMFLHRVQGLKPLGDGGVLIVDGGSQELRYFDAGGRLLRRAGGSGEGPGEFRDPVLVPWVGQDSLLLFDKGLARLQVLSMDGDPRRTIRYSRWPFGRRPPVGALGPDALLFVRSRNVGGEFAARAEGVRKRIFEYVWHDPATAREIAIDSVVIDMTYTSRGAIWSVPFRLRPSAVAVANGVLVSSGRTPEIREYAPSGRLRRIIRVDQHERPVTRDMIAAMRPAHLPGGVTIPRILPFFGATGVWANGAREEALVVDSEGWLWVQVYGWDQTQPKDWMVFDPDGRLSATIRTPRPLQILSIQQDQIWGVWRDDLGAESVRRYALRRYPSAHTATTPILRRHEAIQANR